MMLTSYSPPSVSADKKCQSLPLVHAVRELNPSCFSSDAEEHLCGHRWAVTSGVESSEMIASLGAREQL
jgi:hypothetical protein